MLPLLPASPRLALGPKLAFTAFMAVLVPVYWAQYGPTNFLYFCDLALFLTLGALWTERALLASMAAVGVVLVQMVWCADFLSQLAGFRLTGSTDYMFEASRPLLLRFLSFFHFWLPFLLLWLVRRLGYDRRALALWTLLAWVTLAVCYLFLPAPGQALNRPGAPVNLNYVHGLGDATAQTWMHPKAWLALLFLGLPLLCYLPSHLFLIGWASRLKPSERVP